MLAYLALGSNLGAREAHLRSARASIGKIAGCTLRDCSSLYASVAWGTATPEPDYLNAVVAVDTALSPSDLLRETAEIEQALGRTRNAIRNASRTIDIDILLMGELRLQTDTLTLPHARMHLRAFVLLPLLEIAPGIMIPGHGPAANCLARLPAHDLAELVHNSAWI